MKVCGNSDGFSFNDLGAPDKKRFRRQLSAAINLIKFREDRLVLYAELHDQREELLQGLQEVKGEKSNLIKALEDAKQEAQKRWDEVKVIDADCADMEAEIAQQNKLQRNLRGESEDLKKQANRLKDKIATAELALQEMDAEERKLLPKIVDSPDELQMKIAELNVELEQEKKRLREAEGELKVAEARVRNVTRAIGDISAANNLMDEVTEEKTNFNSMLDEVKRLKEAIHANKEQVEQLENLRRKHQDELDNIGKCIIVLTCCTLFSFLWCNTSF
jgi:chromosome segregation ATPase